MYQKRRESEYRMAEKKKHIYKLYKNQGGGIYRIENFNIVEDKIVKHFLKEPIINLVDEIREEAIKYFTLNKIKWWKVYDENK
jgi:hypothetical protein